MRFSGFHFRFPGTDSQTVWFCGLSNKRPPPPYQSKHLCTGIQENFRPEKDYREKGEARAAKQHNVLVKSLQTVMRKRPLGTWNAKLVTFVGGTCGSVNAMALSQNLKELQVLGSKHDTIRKGLVYELLSAQDKVLCSYYAQRGGQRHQPRHQGMSLDDLLTKLS